MCVFGFGLDLCHGVLWTHACYIYRLHNLREHSILVLDHNSISNRDSLHFRIRKHDIVEHSQMQIQYIIKPIKQRIRDKEPTKLKHLKKIKK